MKRKKLWFVFLFTAICLTIIALITVTYMRRLSYTHITAATKENIVRTSDQVEAIIASHVALLEHTAIGAIPSMRETPVDRDALSLYFDDMQATMNNVLMIYCTNNLRWNSPGGYWASSTGWIPNQDWNNLERSWYQDAKKAQGKVAFTLPYIDAATGKLIVAMARTVFDKDGRDLGVVSEEVSIASLRNILMEHSSLPQQQTYLITQDGLFITHPDESAVMQKDFFAEMGLERYRTQVLSAPSFSALDTDVFIISSLIPQANWIILSTIPAAAIFSDANRSIAIVAGVIIVIFMISIFWIIRLRGEVAKRKLVQQDLEKAKWDADAASQAKSQFLASMSHEIRTPMNAIIGMSDLMRMDNLDEVQISYFSDIKKMAKSLLQIINDILDFSKIEAGKLDIIPVHYNIHGLYDNIVSMSKYTAAMKDLEFRQSLDPSIPEAVFGDEIRVRQVITNIVNNAIKYTRTGFVSLTMKRIHKDNGDFIQITVQDSGIGIKKEDFQKLFGTFQQLDAEKNRGITGTGLGLSITKNLITLMQGEITFDSEYGKGSAFTVTLPLVEGEPDKIELREISERTTAKEGVSVLVVDDNSINLTVASGFLGTHNIFPDTAINGFEAIEKVQAKRYDLVFMDHMMPGMDGLEATKRIRELGGEYKTLPIVALSANAVTGAYETFIKAGMDDFISKPIEALQLNAMLLKYLPPEKINISKTREGKVVPEQAIIDELAHIDELDVNAGLSHIGGNKVAYIQILRQFCAEFDGYIADIKRFWAEENWGEYSIRLHAMKGVFANIGVDSLSKWAYTLEYASKHGDVDLCWKETEAICEAMYSFKGKLLKTSLSAEGERKEKQAISAEGLREKLGAVVEACRHGDTSAADKLGEELSAAAFSDVVDPLIAELCDLISFLDYDLAINKAKEITEKVVQNGAA
jgi:signal transduction histidine kinase/CheY-like chemotaxis protein/HPt (histidine-containing phosphotransfer) domain-containing protein